MNWQPRDWIALVLAITIFFHFMGFAIVTLMQPEYMPEVREIEAIKEVTLVLLGALSGYLGGRADRPMRSSDPTEGE